MNNIDDELKRIIFNFCDYLYFNNNNNNIFSNNIIRWLNTYKVHNDINPIIEDHIRTICTYKFVNININKYNQNKFNYYMLVDYTHLQEVQDFAKFLKIKNILQYKIE